MLIASLVSVVLANGITCAGGNVATSTATTPRFNVSVCVTSDVPWCGLSYRFERINADGTLRINSRTLAVATDANAGVALVFPFAIGANSTDLGATKDPHGPLPAGTKIRVATYNLTVLGSKPATDYRFRLDASAMVAVDPRGSCGALTGGADKDPHRFDPLSLPADAPVAAEFTLRKK